MFTGHHPVLAVGHLHLHHHHLGLPAYSDHDKIIIIIIKLQKSTSILNQNLMSELDVLANNESSPLLINELAKDFWNLIKGDLDFRWI